MDGEQVVECDTRDGKMALMTQVALDTRRRIASRLTPELLTKLRKDKLKRNKPDFSLMQQLFDSGLEQCLASGLPVFNPSNCPSPMKEKLWRHFISMADAINTKEFGAAVSDLEALREGIVALSS